MGCCLSSSADTDSSYATNAANASSRAINAPQPVHSSHDAPQSPSEPQSPARRRRRRDQGPLDQHINKPLRRHDWIAIDRSWTKRQLAAEREEFFDTRVTGRPEIWQTIHVALQMIWEPSSEETNDEDEGAANGLSTAQSILSAAEISLPTGDLVSGAYDSLGNLYQLPEWIVSDPANVIDDEIIRGKGDISVGDGSDSIDQTENIEHEDGGERRREEKGKGVVDVREQVSLRARLSESGRDITISIAKSESVRSVARRVAEESALASNKKVRIAYMGKILNETLSLEDQGWQLGHTVNALVFNQ